MFLGQNHTKNVLIGLALALIGTLCTSLVVRKGLFTTPSSAESTAAPRVELKGSTVDQGKIVVDIEVWNLLDTYVSSILLKLKCTSSNQENSAFFIQLLSEDIQNTWHSSYEIYHSHAMNRGFAFQERRNIHLEFDVDTDLLLTECTELHVFGYR